MIPIDFNAFHNVKVTKGRRSIIPGYTLKHFVRRQGHKWSPIVHLQQFRESVAPVIRHEPSNYTILRPDNDENYNDNGQNPSQH